MPTKVNKDGGGGKKKKGYKETRLEKLKKRKAHDASDDEEMEEKDDDNEYIDEEDDDESVDENKRKKPRQKGEKFWEDESSESSGPVATVYKETSTVELKKIIAERDARIKKLEMELARNRTAGTRLNNTQVRAQLKWTGEEINFAETVHNFCKVFLFVRVKFLKDNWQRYLPKDRKSLYSVCMRHLKIPQGSEPRDIWERVIVPSIARKYQNMKCNLNNDIKAIYMSMTPKFIVCIVYILMIRC